MSLSPNVSPFVPQKLSKPSTTTPYQSLAPGTLSVDVAEFVPSWLNKVSSDETFYNSSVETNSKSVQQKPRTEVKENGKQKRTKSVKSNKNRDGRSRTSTMPETPPSLSQKIIKADNNFYRDFKSSASNQKDFPIKDNLGVWAKVSTLSDQYYVTDSDFPILEQGSNDRSSSSSTTNAQLNTFSPNKSLIAHSDQQHERFNLIGMKQSISSANVKFKSHCSKRNDFQKNSSQFVSHNANTKTGEEDTDNGFSLKHDSSSRGGKKERISRKNINNNEETASGIHNNNANKRNSFHRDVFEPVKASPPSYSDILKNTNTTQVKEPEGRKKVERGLLRIPSSVSDENKENSDEEVEENVTTKKKKKKKKKKSTVEAQPQRVKKSKEALTLDFADVVEKMLESSKTDKKTVIRTGGILPAQAPIPPKEIRNSKKTDLRPAANILDSTAPTVFHRKEREVPKKKKPSAMRKILLKERKEKKLARDGVMSTENEEQILEDESDESEGKTSLSEGVDTAEVKKSIHSRKFREYCDQDLDYDINGLVIQLLRELIRFQDRMYEKDPVKAKMRRRFVCGLREVSKHVKLKRLKCVIVTPNLEPTKSKGGLDDLLSNIIDVCHSQNVPVIFALNRQTLGRVLLKKVPVSIVGIFYYDGAQDYFKKLMTLTEIARKTYMDKFDAAREKFLLEKEKSKENLDEKAKNEEKFSEEKEEEAKENVNIPSSPSLELNNATGSFAIPIVELPSRENIVYYE